MEIINIKETTYKEIAEINKKVPEFGPYEQTYFEQRCNGKDPLLIAAYVNKEVAGYVLGYNKYADGSYYCWMAGVLPEQRKKGVLRKLMQYLETWAKKRAYSKIRIKTRNSRREMLSYLVKENFLFLEVVQFPKSFESRILLEKNI